MENQNDSVMNNGNLLATGIGGAVGRVFGCFVVALIALNSAVSDAATPAEYVDDYHDALFDRNSLMNVEYQ